MESPPDTKNDVGPENELKMEHNVEEEVSKINSERWPNVNGVYDAQGEWHDWNELTYSYSYENSELIILPYTVCLIQLRGESPPATAATD